MSCRLLHCAPGFRASVFAAALTAALVAGNLAVAQTANSNAGLEGGQDNLFDAILGTPNRKTPGPQGKTVATPPGTEQPAATQKSKTKAIPVPPVTSRISPGAHQ